MEERKEKIIVIVKNSEIPEPLATNSEEVCIEPDGCVYTYPKEKYDKPIAVRKSFGSWLRMVGDPNYPSARTNSKAINYILWKLYKDEDVKRLKYDIEPYCFWLCCNSEEDEIYYFFLEVVEFVNKWCLVSPEPLRYYQSMVVLRVAMGKKDDSGTAETEYWSFDHLPIFFIRQVGNYRNRQIKPVHIHNTPHAEELSAIVRYLNAVANENYKREFGDSKTKQEVKNDY